MSAEMADDNPVKLRPRDYGIISLETLIQAVPYIGGPFCAFVFGRLSEIRLQRIERTLTEIGAAMKARRMEPSAIITEEFSVLFESIAPALAKTTTEEKRERFRDLLLNAAELKPGAPDWEDAMLAAEILQAVEAPGLAVVGALASCRLPVATAFRRPFPRIVDGHIDGANEDADGMPLPYEWIVVEEWIRRLRDQRLIGMSSTDARGGFGGVHLTDLGQWFVRWILDEPVKKGGT